MMKKYIASLLIGLFAFPIMPAHAGLSESDRAQITIRQRLVNPGFETSTAGWAASTAAHLSIITSGVGSGNASAQWAPTGAGETLSSGYVTVSSGDGLSSTPGVASCKLKVVSGTGLPTIEAFDGTNKITSVAITPNTSGYTRTSANFIFPASGTTRLQFTSVASPATVALDDCYLGIAEGFNLSTSVITTTPTIQKFTSGSGTYTTPAGVTFIRVRMVGGGASGSGGGSGGTSGSAGNASTFGSSLLTASGGAASSGGSQVGGVGGSATVNSPATGTAISGGSGGTAVVAAGASGGIGGSGAFGGGGGAGAAATANTGAGGGGGNAGSGGAGGGGGGAGGYVDAVISGPASTYSYAVGATQSTVGAAGTGGAAGGAGGSGYIEVTEYYGSTTQTLYTPNNVSASWSGYHDTNCAWTTTSASFVDVTDSTCTLQQRQNSNFGTVTSATSGGNPEPGISFNPQKTGKFYVKVSFNGRNSTGTGNPAAYKLVDGAGNQLDLVWDNPSGAGFDHPYSLQGVVNAASTSSATSVRVQIQSNGTATQSINQSAQTVEWSIFQLDAGLPWPILANPETVSAAHNAFSTGGGSTASTWYIPESTWGVTLTPGMWDIQMDGNADTAISGTYGVQVIAGLSDGTSHLAYSMCGMAISGPTPSTQEVGCHVHVTYTATSTVTVKPELRFLGFTGSGSVTLNWRNNLDTQPTGSLVARRVK